ncbi:MAG TPA: hypothetical protein VN814_19120 [Caulobacteraceae bacterium]|nr:hypothetical protein [Caulobacteraceae bacterium]
MKLGTHANRWLLGAAIAFCGAAAQAHVSSVTVSPASLTGAVACPIQQIFIGQISSTTPGKVAFQWTTSDGQHSPLQAAIFDAAGKRPVSYLWMALSKQRTIDGWVRLDTRSPNHLTAKVRIAATCKP